MPSTAEHERGLHAADHTILKHALARVFAGRPGNHMQGQKMLLARDAKRVHRGRSTQVVARPSVRTSDYASVLRLVLAGGGIGPIPSLVARASVASGALLPVLPDWSVSKGTLYAISLGGRGAPARVRVFREFVRTELAVVP